MNVYVANFTMTRDEIFATIGAPANLTSDPFGSPVYHLRSLLGV